MPRSLFGDELAGDRRRAAPGEPVALVAPERRFDLPVGLSYRVPQDLVGSIAAGDRVTIPLGKGDAPCGGIVLEVKSSSGGGDPGPALKAIIGRDGPRLTPALLRLAAWMSNYYCAPIGSVLGGMVPGAVKQRTARRVRRLVRPAPGVPEPPAGPKTREVWTRVCALDPATFPMTAAALAERLGLGSTAPVSRLKTLGLLEEVLVERAARAWGGEAGAAAVEPPPTLSAAQATAIDRIVRGLGEFRPFLLYGVTGSGKTEVYLQTIGRVIGRDQSALVLVPEISLTPQTARRFLGRFGEAGVAVLHSGLTPAQRTAEWRRAAEGRARVVIGARSAVFAPLGLAGPRLGLIVVDEEHDSSYKQDQSPRYHGRDVAIKRAQLEGCAVVLGSATPSLESWSNAHVDSGGRRARYELLELPDRVTGAPLPRVRVVDMRKERLVRTGRARWRSLGPTLEWALGETLREGRQAMLLLNRRGYASHVCCPSPSCGWVLACDDCDATMVVHHDRLPPPGAPPRFVRCHHCRAEQLAPGSCPECGRRVITFGAGTQRLEEELERTFDGLRLGDTLLRLDADTMRRSGDYFKALEAFGSGRVRVLIGTQMIAKGLDFPGVSLVGVVNADTSIHIPDFRASERTFQLIAQVAGRAGRAPGIAAQVIVQTMQPESRPIQLAAKHDYRTFADEELTLRRRMGLPPCRRMARVVVRGPSQDGVRRTAIALMEAARARREGDVQIEGPTPCLISRLSGHWREQLEIIGSSSAGVLAVLQAVQQCFRTSEPEQIAIDMDVQDVL